jgi:hypothetical protein
MTIIIDKWAGLATNVSPYAIPPGAAVTQVNLQCLSPGQLSVRKGMATLSWTTHAGSTIPITTLQRFQSGTLETVVYQNASGVLFYAKGPT